MAAVIYAHGNTPTGTHLPAHTHTHDQSILSNLLIERWLTFTALQPSVFSVCVYVFILECVSQCPGLHRGRQNVHTRHKTWKHEWLIYTVFYTSFTFLSSSLFFFLTGVSFQSMHIWVPLTGAWCQWSRREMRKNNFTLPSFCFWLVPKKWWTKEMRWLWLDLFHNDGNDNYSDDDGSSSADTASQCDDGSVSDDDGNGKSLVFVVMTRMMLVMQMPTTATVFNQGGIKVWPWRCESKCVNSICGYHLL